MIHVTINGDCHEFPAESISLEEVIAALDLEPRTLLIEHNGTALAREDWHGRPVAHGDSLEILRIAAGG